MAKRSHTPWSPPWPAGLADGAVDVDPVAWLLCTAQCATAMPAKASRRLAFIVIERLFKRGRFDVVADVLTGLELVPRLDELESLARCRSMLGDVAACRRLLLALVDGADAMTRKSERAYHVDRVVDVIVAHGGPAPPPSRTKAAHTDDRAAFVRRVLLDDTVVLQPATAPVCRARPAAVDLDVVAAVDEAERALSALHPDEYNVDVAALAVERAVGGLCARGRVDDAAALLTRATTTYDGDTLMHRGFSSARALVALAKATLHLEQHARARTLLQRAVDVDGAEIVMPDIAAVLVQLGDVELAQAVARKAPKGARLKTVAEVQLLTNDRVGLAATLRAVDDAVTATAVAWALAYAADPETNYWR